MSGVRDRSTLDRATNCSPTFPRDTTRGSQSSSSDRHILWFLSTDWKALRRAWCSGTFRPRAVIGREVVDYDWLLSRFEKKTRINMAPRKRTTKQPKNNPRTAKLEAFLDDFDSEVKTRVVQMKGKLSQLLKEVDTGYNMALIKLPKAIRQLNWIQYFNAEKPKSPEVDHKKTNLELTAL
uniref:Borealin N-terminal domain-containing protein n=1 Tax=Knipowitschia caucasica TaxID=637954 RepID=A0AAV2K444_KNICA